VVVADQKEKKRRAEASKPPVHPKRKVGNPRCGGGKRNSITTRENPKGPKKGKSKKGP